MPIVFGGDKENGVHNLTFLGHKRRLSRASVDCRMTLEAWFVPLKLLLENVYSH